MKQKTTKRTITCLRWVTIITGTIMVSDLLKHPFYVTNTNRALAAIEILAGNAANIMEKRLKKKEDEMG